MRAYQLTKTDRSFTLGDLTQPIGSVLMEKRADFIRVYNDKSSVTFHYSDIIGVDEEEFMSSDAAITYLETQLFKIGGGDGSGVTTDASLLTSGTLNPERLGNDSIQETKLDAAVRGKLNASSPENSVTKTELFNIVSSPNPELVTNRYQGQLWSTGSPSVLQNNASFSAINQIPATQGQKFAITGITSFLVNMGRMLDSSGNYIAPAFTSANFELIPGGHVFTVPSNENVAFIALHFAPADLDNISIQAGDTVVTEIEYEIKPELYISTKVDREEIYERNLLDLAEIIGVNNFWGANGLYAVLSGFSAFKKIDTSVVKEISIKGIIPTLVVGEPTARIGRYYDVNGAYLSNVTGDKILNINGGHKIIAPTNAHQVGFFFANDFATDVELYYGDRILDRLQNEVLPDLIQTDGDAMKFYERGKILKPNVSALMPAYIIAGQSQFEGRLPTADLPAWWAADGNQIVGVNILENTTPTWNVYNSTNFHDPSGTPRWSMEILLLKSIIDNNKAVSGSDEIYVIKNALGGTSIEPVGAGDGRWSVEFDEIPNDKTRLSEILEARIRAGITSTEGSNFNIKALIWAQGESDKNFSGKYYRNLKNLIYYYRGIVQNPKLPVILIGINQLSSEYNGTVESAKIQLASDDKFVFYAPVTTNELTHLQADKLHFNLTGATEVMNNAYTIMNNNKGLFGLK